MNAKKITLIREKTVGAGIGQRISYIEYDEDTNQLIRPDARMNAAVQAEWDRIMAILQDVNGEDLRPIVDGPGLLDYCLANA